MRIALDASCLASNGRGFARYVQALLQGLEGALPPGDALLLYSDRPITPELLPARFRDSLRVLPPRRFHALWRRRDLVRAALADKADLLHFTDNEIADCRPLPSVVTVHGIGALIRPELRLVSLPMRLYLGRVVAAIGKRAGVVIAVSDDLRQDLERLWGACRPPVRTVHSGILPQKPVEETGPRFPQPYFLFVGALEAYKNLPNLLRAFAIFRARTSLPHHLVLLGRIPCGFGVLGADRRLLEQPAVLLAGDLPLASPAWPRLYREATALTLVSWYETFGFPYVEAMAYDCPVLGTTAGSGPEVIADAGLLADPADPDAIAAALTRLATESALREDLARRGRERIKRFTVEAMAEGTLAAYREALDR